MAALAIALGLVIGLSALNTPVARADEPASSPAPLVFHTPQYLVWMDRHSTSSGPVEDNAYWLYVAPPDENGRFAVPDGGGGVFWYTGRLVAGPFLGEADACPAMLAVGVTSLQAWIVAAGEDAQIADCTRYLATPPAGAGPAGGAGSSGDDPAPGDEPPPGGEPAVGAGPDTDDMDPEALGLAVALIGLLLFGGGALLTVRGRGAAHPGSPPGSRSEPTAQPIADPCANQVAALARASASGRYLNGLLASCRRYEALLQEQIDVLANLVLPGSVMLDLGFAAGGLSGGLAGPLGRKLVASTTFRAAVGESIAKDVAKELAKQGLGSAGGTLDPAKLAAEGGKSGLKQTLLEGLETGLVNKHFFDSLSPDAPTRVFRDAGEYAGFVKEIEAYARDVATPIKDGLGALIDLYDGVSGGFELKARLDQLRTLRDRIADRRVDLELRFEDVLAEQRDASERLAHCRTINAPGWRP